MAVAIRMPQPGQMTEECTVLQWFKAEGDRVSRGDPLFEIETDKSNMEIEAFDEGVLLRVDAAGGRHGAGRRRRGLDRRRPGSRPEVAPRAPRARRQRRGPGWRQRREPGGWPSPGTIR